MSAIRLLDGVKNQLLYRPSCDPTLKKISTYAVAFISALGLIALRYRSAANVVPKALAAAAVVWLAPFLADLLPKKIDFQRLKRCGITETDLQNYEAGDFNKFEIFLKALSREVVRELKWANLFPRLFPIIQKGIEERKLSDETIQAAFILFREEGAFRTGNLAKNVSLLSSEGKKIKVSKTVLLMSSPSYFVPILSGDYAEGRNHEIRCPELSTEALDHLSLFLDSQERTGSSFDIESGIFLHNFSRMTFMTHLNQYVTEQIHQQAARSYHEKSLTSFLQIFERFHQDNLLRNYIDPKWMQIIVLKAFTAFFKSLIQLTYDRFAVPVTHVSFLKQEGIIGAYLRKHVNSLSFSYPLDQESYEKLIFTLKLLQRENIEKITSFTFFPSYLEKVDSAKQKRFFSSLIKQLPKVNKAYQIADSENDYRISYQRSKIGDIFFDLKHLALEVCNLSEKV